MGKKFGLVGVIKEDTTEVGFSVFSLPYLKKIVGQRKKLCLICEEKGWVEQDPTEIINGIRECAFSVYQKLSDMGCNVNDLLTIGITNQTETIVVWNKFTGQPLYNTIVSTDSRAEATVERILKKVPKQDMNYFQHLTGLQITARTPAIKLCWLIENVPEIKEALKKNECLFGTIDTFIVWHLTGGKHLTDVTNASRTFLMNIHTMQWDNILAEMFEIESSLLPRICSCSEVYGIVNDCSALTGTPISGIMGGHQASLFGHHGLNAGCIRGTFSKTKCNILCNIGKAPLFSNNGFVTTIAYQLGPFNTVYYALEGSFPIDLKWMQNNLGIKHVCSVEDEASKATSSGVYFVPAFNGLLPPYSNKDARGIICGLTLGTKKSHMMRAALEQICFQTKDIFEYFLKNFDINIVDFRADGSLCKNKLLMRLLTDILGRNVLLSPKVDPREYGIAVCASSARDVYAYLEVNTSHICLLSPRNTANNRCERYERWKMALQRSLDWKREPSPEGLLHFYQQFRPSLWTSFGVVLLFIFFATFVNVFFIL